MLNLGKVLTVPAGSSSPGPTGSSILGTPWSSAPSLALDDFVSQPVTLAANQALYWTFRPTLSGLLRFDVSLSFPISSPTLHPFSFAIYGETGGTWTTGPGGFARDHSVVVYADEPLVFEVRPFGPAVGVPSVVILRVSDYAPYTIIQEAGLIEKTVGDMEYTIPIDSYVGHGGNRRWSGKTFYNGYLSPPSDLATLKAAALGVGAFEDNPLTNEPFSRGIEISHGNQAFSPPTYGTTYGPLVPGSTHGLPVGPVTGHDWEFSRTLSTGSGGYGESELFFWLSYAWESTELEDDSPFSSYWNGHLWGYPGPRPYPWNSTTSTSTNTWTYFDPHTMEWRLGETCAPDEYDFVIPSPWGFDRDFETKVRIQEAWVTIDHPEYNPGSPDWFPETPVELFEPGVFEVFAGTASSPIANSYVATSLEGLGQSIGSVAADVDPTWNRVPDSLISECRNTPNGIVFFSALPSDFAHPDGSNSRKFFGQASWTFKVKALAPAYATWDTDLPPLQDHSFGNIQGLFDQARARFS